jgi:hypothetical protein
VKRVNASKEAILDLGTPLFEAYGMPNEHIAKMLALAEEEDTVISFRPVPAGARRLIEEGCVGKPFGIDIKSSNFGMTAGFLCKDIRFSGRYDASSATDVAKHRAQLAKTEHYMALYGYSEKPLTLSPERLDELLSLGKITVSAEKKEGAVVYQAINDFGETYYFKAQLKEGRYEILHYNQETGEEAPVKVLADGEGHFITSDYDLLVACPHQSAFSPGSKDKSPIRTQGSGGEGEEDKYRGNVSPRLDALIDKAQEKLARPLIYHNAEFNNPFASSDMRSNLPALFVFPKEFDLSPFLEALKIKNKDQTSEEASTAVALLVETEDELLLLRDFLLEKNYYWPAHCKHQDYKPLGSSRYTEAVDAMERAIAARRGDMSSDGLASMTHCKVCKAELHALKKEHDSPIKEGEIAAENKGLTE